MNPLLPWGRGENLENVVPYLHLNKANKQELGDYLKYFYILGKSKNIWNDYDEFIVYDNLESVKRLNCCGKTITFMEGKYYYCMPLSGKDEFCFANLGELNYEKYKQFAEGNKHICNMKNNRFKLDEKNNKAPIGYGICAICRNIYEGNDKSELCNNKHE